MVVVIDQHSGVPVFRQLRDQIRFQIVSGMLEPGEELPSTRALSAELGLNPMTISKAYSRLEVEGLVEKRPGLPLVVRELDPEEVNTQRLAQFRERAKPLAAVARQLGLSREQATRIFGEIFDGNGTGVGEGGGGRVMAEFDSGEVDARDAGRGGLDGENIGRGDSLGAEPDGAEIDRGESESREVE